MWKIKLNFIRSRNNCKLHSRFNMAEEEEKFVIEKIVTKRVVNGIPEYLIKWQGYPQEDNTWELAKDLLDWMELVINFERDWATAEDMESSSDEDEDEEERADECEEEHADQDEEERADEGEEEHTDEGEEEPADEDEEEHTEQDEEERAIERVLQRRIVNDELHYLIKWLGYPENKNSWEPAYILDVTEDLEKIEIFEQEWEAVQAAEQPA